MSFLHSSLLLGLAGAAQDSTDPFDVRLRHGRTAIEAGDTQAAAHHLQQALILRPGSEEALELLFENAAGQADARLLWALQLWGARCDEKGKWRGSADLSGKLLRVVPHVEALAVARAAAAGELAKLCAAESKKASRGSTSSAAAAALVATWAADFGTQLTDSMPALGASLSSDFAVDEAIGSRLSDGVIKELKRVHSRAASGGDHSTAVRAARIVRGLAAQGAFDDLQGPVPSGISALSRWALEALEKSRARLSKALGEPLTVDQLLEMDEEQSREFSRAHADLALPGVALSPRGMYRIETCCGYETLLGVAESVELHHDRLAKWYGRDPFEDRPGLLRILPEAAGLESEGAGFWWVGGFQGGDTTTLRFSCGTIEGLGHGIVHELTHRFDGALFPGTPAWLAEGKAVWTGGSYGSSYDEAFVEDHIEFGTVESAWIKGYGGEQKLRDLITGEIEDYRDNYVAGYALYVYLKLWQREDGAPVYLDRLQRYMAGLRDQNKRPEEWFTANFADGKDGRPADFRAFAAAFQEFMAGFYWDDRAPWTERYTSQVEQVGGGWVYDAPTWTWSRNRAEPYWGQDQAWRAGDLLLDVDKANEAAVAYLWAWSVDEHSPRRQAALAKVLESIGEEESAWVLRNDITRNRLRSRGAASPASAPPFALPKTQAFLQTLADEVTELRSAGRELAASALAADHNRWAAWIGVESIDATRPELPAKTLHPWDEPARRLGLAGAQQELQDGWTEDGLTGYEERRAPGCWYLEVDGDLHVGRERPRDNTGSLDRQAHNRHAFALTRASQVAGRYVLRCKVQFTTSYASGALILGYQRRDRNVRLHFTAGDFYYSIGKKEQGEEIERVSWSVSGLRDRDGPLSGSARSGGVAFDSPRTSFELVALVDGAAAHFWIEDQYLGSYHDALGTPIAGPIGFATGMGAVRVIDPTIQRLDRSRQAGLPLRSAGDEDLVEAGLDLHAPTRDSFRHLINHPVAGLVPDANGTLVVWVPLPELDEQEPDADLDACVIKALELAGLVEMMSARAGASQPVLMVLPDRLDATRREVLHRELATIFAELAWRTTTYAWERQAESSEEVRFSQHRPWLCFVDSAGVLRICDRFYGMTRSYPDDLMHWLTVFRDDDGRR